jgi:hypothetical protein
MIALYITAGRVTADPRYGDPATRLVSAARQLSGEDAEDTMRRGLEWIAQVTRRRPESTPDGDPHAKPRQRTEPARGKRTPGRDGIHSTRSS